MELYIEPIQCYYKNKIPTARDYPNVYHRTGRNSEAAFGLGKPIPSAAATKGEPAMQYRMRTHQLPQDEMNALLEKSLTGTLSTVDSDGAPYSVPIHFVFLDGAIYFHGLPVGQKLGNLKTDPRVCFTVYEMTGLLLDPEEKPCDTNTAYTSVVIRGTAKPVEEIEEKLRILSAIVQKYTPHLTGKEIPANMLKGTAVVKISIADITGKYYQ